VPSAAVHPIEAVTRVTRLAARAAKLEALKEHLERERSALEADVERLGGEIEKLLKVEELFRALMDQLVVHQVRALEAVVTDGLQTIFFDQSLHFESDIEAKYGKVSIDFQLRQGAMDDPLAIRGSPLESFGGGPSSVISLILRVLTLLKLKRLPFLVLDETLLAVSDEYCVATGKFLQTLAEKMNLHFLLITHKPAYLDYSHRAYQGREETQGDQRALRVQKLSSSESRALRSKVS
jgi:chromosome segregation ATPase